MIVNLDRGVVSLVVAALLYVCGDLKSASMKSMDDVEGMGVKTIVFRQLSVTLILLVSLRRLCVLYSTVLEWLMSEKSRRKREPRTQLPSSSLCFSAQGLAVVLMMLFVVHVGT